MAQSKYTVEVASENPYDLGEGPFWDEKERRLYFVDAFVGDFVKLDPETRREEKVHLDDTVTLIIPCEDNPEEFIVTKWGQIYRMNWRSKAMTLLGEVEKGSKLCRLNDGKCDAKGRLWMGTMGIESSPGVFYPKMGSLYSMDNDLTIKQWIQKVNLSNGIAWSNDNTKMYFVDTVKRVVYVYDFDLEAGSIANQRILFDFNGNPDCRVCELPDGMTVDVDDNLWVACWGGGRIIKVAPQSGALIDFIQLPATQITSLCFGGDNWDTMYVTSARKGLTEEQAKGQPLAGHTFKVTFKSKDVKGFRGHRFVAK